MNLLRFIGQFTGKANSKGIYKFIPVKLAALSSIACCLLLFSCSFQSNKASENTPRTDTLSAGDNEETIAVDTTEVDYLYVFENDTVKQYAIIRHLTDTEISFKYTVENKIRKQSVVIQGTAKDKHRGEDSETDEDDEGEMYPVDEYVYNNNCWLAFRIDMDTQARMRIHEADCPQSNPYCPLGSVGILMVQKGQ